MKTTTSVVKAKAKAKSSKAKAPRASAKANDSAFRKVIGFAALGGAAIGVALGATFA